MTAVKDLIKKICLLGDPAVGKTSLIRRYVFDMFDDKYITTIGTKVTKKTVTVPPLRPEAPTIKITLLIWDILGQREYARLHPVYYQGAEAAFIVCDGTRGETGRSLATWAQSFHKVVGDVPLVFLVNKWDLIDPATFDGGSIAAVAEQYGAKVYYTSALVGTNVNDAFTHIAELLAAKVR